MSEEAPRQSLFSPGSLLVLVLAAGAVVFFASMQRRIGHASFALNTTPPGASAFLNGHLLGPTPVSVPQLKYGNYSLRVEKDGFMPVVRMVDVDSADVRVTEALQKRGVGTLIVNIKPRGAEVLVDGELLGQTPFRREDIPVGQHDLLIRKTNFKPYSQRIDVAAGEPLNFADFALENVVLTMLRAAVEKDKQRVSNYMDLGHYLFANDELDESAEVYKDALRVAHSTLVFDKDATREERDLEQRLRQEDLSRLSEEIRKKTHWPGKDTARWAAAIHGAQENVATANVSDWTVVYEQVQNFTRDGKPERAQELLVRHIETAKDVATLPQAYIQLMTIRLRLRSLETLRETYTQFCDRYGNDPALARQAGNAIYTGAATFNGPQQKELLGMAERLLLRAAGNSNEPEMRSLCRFELANVMTMQGRYEQAIPIYRESALQTVDPGTRELRNLRQVECLMKMRDYVEARAVLTRLAHSPRPEVSQKATEDIRALDAKIRDELRPLPPGEK